MKPRIHRQRITMFFADMPRSVWVCCMPHQNVLDCGYGDTPALAYHDWKLQQMLPA